MPASRRSTLEDPVHIPKVRYRSRNDEIVVGDDVFVYYNATDGSAHEVPAKIVDIRTIESAANGGEEVQQFYVHYAEKDRRLDEWIDRSRIAESLPAALLTPTIPLHAFDHQQPLTRSQRRMQEEFSHKQKSYEEMDATTAKLEKMHEERTKVKNVQKAVVGKWEMDVWYYSPYPVDVVPHGTDVVYHCEYCLFYYTNIRKFKKHMATGCQRRQPPGQCIYRDGNLAVFEVFGCVYKASTLDCFFLPLIPRFQLYCQCLCLLSKLFLDHKTLYWAMENFRFYVLCEVDAEGAHLVGHFSKEQGTNNNLACIMVLPPFQRRGYGKLLIQLSYAISRREKRIATPEKPLSDLGKVSYRSYWWWTLIRVLDQLNIDRNIAVSELSQISGIHPEDIVSTFNVVNMVRYYKTVPGSILLCSRAIINHCKTFSIFKPPKLPFKDECLRWSTDERFVPLPPRAPPKAQSASRKPSRDEAGAASDTRSNS
ncbi:Histone acetyltransferase [Aphelenchoides fujianensis]|nr:Histone acetyltransferase [Aphelenchoides fujianensis]